MKSITTACLTGMLLSTSLHAGAHDTVFWRILSSETTVVSVLSADGVIMWSNSTPDHMEQVQQATSLRPANWQNYILVPATAMVTSVRVSSPSPPLNMALIPAGSFVMGNATNVFLPGDCEGNDAEQPQHTVYVSAFYMEVYEVTKALWDKVWVQSVSNGYVYSNTGSGKATNYPVHTVNWHDVTKWCNARSEQDGLTPVYYTNANFTTVYKTGEVETYVDWSANGYRLPTEAEWEKAARGGVANNRFPWNDTNTIQHTRANYKASSIYNCDTSPTLGYHPDYNTGDFRYTSPVGSFAPNGYGLYDMAGNLAEWCWDRYADDYYPMSPASNPRGPSWITVSRVKRGGAWFDSAIGVRVAHRSAAPMDYESHIIGFRCARGL